MLQLNNKNPTQHHQNPPHNQRRIHIRQILPTPYHPLQIPGCPFLIPTPPPNPNPNIPYTLTPPLHFPIYLINLQQKPFEPYINFIQKFFLINLIYPPFIHPSPPLFFTHNSQIPLSITNANTTGLNPITVLS